MARTAENYEERQEFWKPAVPQRQESVPTEAANHVCEHCGTDFVVGSRFCHVCGADRHTVLPEKKGVRTWFDFAALREALGQSSASLVTLFLGMACLIAAAVTGFLFTATTLLDWQAVQIWRIEWLLAAVAVFIAGVLLKRR
jgi:hypothetical protein